MREILFRGKRVDNGEWVEGALISLYHGHTYICPDVTASHFSGLDNSLLFGRWYEVDPSTVGQYTGLTDKNGKRIFEGDVFEEWFPPDPVEKDPKPWRSVGVFGFDTIGFTIAYVEGQRLVGGYYVSEHFDPAPAGFRTDRDTDFDFFDVTVIGNIHDNPELLKQGDADGV